MNPDAYYQRTEVSNSDLTELKNLLHPGISLSEEARQAAFHFGSLVDALITEPQRCNFYNYTVDGESYNPEDWEHAIGMRQALLDEARNDPFLNHILHHADTQTVMVRQQEPLEYCGFHFALDTRCKWDWYDKDFGGDLKTTFATSQAEFEEAIDFFDWDRSRAWYMDIANSDRDFIYAISKRNFRVFKHFIRRGDKTYERGREKYSELAFHYWCLNLN